MSTILSMLNVMVYTKIEEMIVNFVLLSCLRISDKKTTSEAGVILRQVREALIRLAEEGIVHMITNSEFRVKKSTLNEIKANFLSFINNILGLISTDYGKHCSDHMKSV